MAATFSRENLADANLLPIIAKYSRARSKISVNKKKSTFKKQ